MKKLSILLLILLSFGLLSCEMTVAQDETALVEELDSLDDAIGVLETKMGDPKLTVEELETELIGIQTIIGDISQIDNGDTIIGLIIGLQTQLANLPPTTIVYGYAEIKNSVVEIIDALVVIINNGGGGHNKP